MHIKKIARVVLLTLLVLLATGFFLLLFIQSYVNRHTRTFASEKVQLLTGGTYSISFRSSDISLLSGSARFEDICFLPAGTNDSLDVRYSIGAKKLNIEGIQVWDLYRNKKMTADLLEIVDLLVFVQQGGGKGHRSEKPPGLFQSSGMGPGTFHKVEISNATLTISKAGKGIFCSRRGRLNAVDVVTGGSDNDAPKIRADSFQIDAGYFSYRLADSLYTIKGKAIIASSSDSLLQVILPELVPNYSKMDFGPAVGHQTSRVKLNARQLSLLGLDVLAFVEEDCLIAKRLRADGLEISIFRDGRIPLLKKDRASMQKIIGSCPFGLLIDTAEIVNANITFEELKEGQKTAGKLHLSGISGLISGLDNSFGGGREIRFSSSGSLESGGKLYLFCVFPLNDSTEHFRCSGMLVGMDVQKLNSFVEPNMRLSLKRGYIDSLGFSFSANDQESRGTLTSKYHDLHLEAVQNDGSGKKFYSGLADAIVRDNNPDERGRLVEGKIHFERNHYRFFPYYIYMSVMSGLPTSVGIPVVVSHD